MSERFKQLPNWCITNENPAFYDTESKTVIEQTARLYAKFQELIIDYNNFIDEVNNNINTFFSETDNDIIDFKAYVNELLENINNYVVTNLITTEQNILNEALENGLIDVKSEYDSENERLDLKIKGVVI